MRILVISSAPIIEKNRLLYGYPPLVNEMELWIQNFESVCVIAPDSYPSKFDVSSFTRKDIKFIPVSFLQFDTPNSILRSVQKFPAIFFKIYKEIKRTDHIHIRCPGNISLLGCIVQIFFPKKKKTVKYAGNWDPNSKQPLSYRFQKWLLSNKYLSRNIKVLVYGDWPDQSANILPFFTASYSQKEILKASRVYDQNLKFLYVGSLSEGKQPDFAIKLVERILKNGISAELRIYGSGVLFQDLQDYVEISGLSDSISILGFKNVAELKQSYLDSHFLLLPSKSEGWPKVVAEAMFFGCIPIVTAVSCVPWMLGHGSRGILIPDDVDAAAKNVLTILSKPSELEEMSDRAQNWSKEYTLEKFEREIKGLL